MNEKKFGANKCIYNWLFWLTIMFFILAGFCIYNWYKITSGNLRMDFSSDGTYIAMIIAVAGFLAAFSAISIYSIFNTTVDKEKQQIEKLRIKFQKDIENIQKRTEEAIQGNIEKEKQNLKRDLNESIKNLDNLGNNTIRIFDLTSPYSLYRKKIEAIKDYKNRSNVDDDTKDFILNYYKSLGDEERNKRYYLELQELLTQWGKT